jgi:hypothetical protein
MPHTEWLCGNYVEAAGRWYGRRLWADATQGKSIAIRVSGLLPEIFVAPAQMVACTVVFFWYYRLTISERMSSSLWNAIK